MRKNWKCPQCGTLNTGDFNICSNCFYDNSVTQSKPINSAGSKQTTSMQSESSASEATQAGSSSNQELQGYHKDPSYQAVDKPDTGKKINKKAIIAVSAIFVLIVAGLFYVGQNQKIHYAALELEQEGEYARAVEKAAEDRFFSKDITKANYIEQAIEQYKDKKYDKALEILNDFKGDSEADKYRNLCHFEKMTNYVDKKKYDEAIQEAALIDDKSLDVTESLDKAYMSQGKACMDEGKYGDAKRKFGMIKGDESAKDYAELAELIDGRDYIDAAILAKSIEAKDGEIDFESWKTYINKAIDDECYDDFQQYGAYCVFGEKPDFTSDSSKLSYKGPVDGEFYSNAVERKYSLEGDLKAAQGDKILIVWQVTDYRSKDIENYIAWDLMQQLPIEQFPRSFEEVGKIVRIACGGSFDGTYGNSYRTIEGIREHGQVLVGKSLTGNEIWYGSRIAGPECPYTISVSSGQTLYYGGFPNMTNDIRTGIRKAIES